jgi:hypothetical protein
MPMNCCAKCELLGNCCSCSTHQIKLRIENICKYYNFLKSDNSIIRNPNVASLIEIRTPNAPSS